MFRVFCVHVWSVGDIRDFYLKILPIHVIYNDAVSEIFLAAATFVSLLHVHCSTSEVVCRKIRFFAFLLKTVQSTFKCTIADGIFSRIFNKNVYNTIDHDNNGD